jgi:hypothetical protein
MGGFSERKAADQKFFSVSGMGFGQQFLERRRASFFELSREGLEAREMTNVKVQNPNVEKCLS